MARNLQLRAAAGALLASVGCGSSAAQPSSVYVGDCATEVCATQVIVAFSKDQGSRPNGGFVRELARADGVQLRFLRTIGPDLYVFSLATPEPKCRDALERLRRDARVRSVSVDQRRRYRAL